MKIVALSGYARSGKDEAASVLVNEFGFVQVAFADKLREMLYNINPLISVWRSWDQEPGAVYVQDAIDRYGWTGYKETMYGDEIRRLLQRLGTEGGRWTLWDSIWIDAAFANLDPDSKVVVSDARFINEFEAVRSRGGNIWRIERPGIGAQSDHPSETEAVTYRHFHRILFNSGSLTEYQNKVKRAWIDDELEQIAEGKL